MDRRTAATNGLRDHVINLRINAGDAMMLGGGRCREGGADNDRNGKRNFYLAEHFRISRLSFATQPEIVWPQPANTGRDRKTASVVPMSSKVDVPRQPLDFGPAPETVRRRQNLAI